MTRIVGFFTIPDNYNRRRYRVGRNDNVSKGRNSRGWFVASYETFTKWRRKFFKRLKYTTLDEVTCQSKFHAECHVKQHDYIILFKAIPRRCKKIVSKGRELIISCRDSEGKYFKYSVVVNLLCIEAIKEDSSIEILGTRVLDELLFETRSRVERVRRNENS